MIEWPLKIKMGGVTCLGSCIKLQTSFSYSRALHPLGFCSSRAQITRDVLLYEKNVYNWYFKVAFRLPPGPGVLRWMGSVSSGRDSESSGILRHSGPAHPKHSTLENRLRTFRDWPPALKQQPQELAEAGFFYIGKM